MICRNCGTDNGEVRKTCCCCGEYLEGYVINNVTGKFGYRDSEGMFYEKREDYNQ